MENASKALLMAGGVLFAIIVISIFALAYSNITMMKQADVDKQQQEELDRFNKTLLAFNKKAMYGTDVISILNFAISSNEIYNVEFGENYYVDVSFKLTEDSIQDRIFKYTLNPETSIYSMQEISIGTIEATRYGAMEQQFIQGQEYSLSANLEGIKIFLMTAEQNEETKTYDAQYEGLAIIPEYTIKYSGIADFKRKTFKCSGVAYGSDGRVRSLRFEQINAATYGGE